MKLQVLGALGALALGTLALAACGEQKPAAPAATPAPAKPADLKFDGPPKQAIWKIQDADTTVYFFGTVHMLPPGATWRTPAFDQALADAKAVYLEADIDLPEAEMIAMVDRLARLDPSRKLSDFLTSEQAAAVTKAATAAGVPMPVLEMYKPWFAAMTLSNFVIEKTGFKSELGVEILLRPEAEKAGKEVRFLETAEEQLGKLAGLSDEVQVKFLVAGLEELDKAGEMLTEMVHAWRAGDDAALNRLLNEEDEADAIPEVHKAMMVDRNANWAPQIDALMDTEAGTFLVAVGAAHLVGPDSVLEMLKPLGHTATRVQ
jgi:uncharacterized protein YbaP (TraB family)